jgi:phage baseplate assembly protein W
MATELGRFNTQDLSINADKVLGIGINKQSDSNGIFAVNYTTLSQAKDNIVNLIMTRKGERTMQPEFGCDIWQLIFEPITTDTLEFEIESSIVEAVNTWLPYLSIDQILFDYDTNDIDNHKIYLQIAFSLKINRDFGESVTILVEQ